MGVHEGLPRMHGHVPALWPFRIPACILFHCHCLPWHVKGMWVERGDPRKRPTVHRQSCGYSHRQSEWPPFDLRCSPWDARSRARDDRREHVNWSKPAKVLGSPTSSTPFSWRLGQHDRFPRHQWWKQKN